jgi:hypothetical protein
LLCLQAPQTDFPVAQYASHVREIMDQLSITKVRAAHDSMCPS